MNERPKCGCGNTNDPNGYCDGSHANLVKEDRNEHPGGDNEGTDDEVFTYAIENPAEPNETLKEAANKYKAKVSWNPGEIDGWHILDVEAELKDVLEEDLKNTLKEEIKKNKK